MNYRWLKSLKLKKANEKGFEGKSFPDIYEAVKKAGEDADAVFAFGSLYMYKELKKLLMAGGEINENR